MNAWIRQSTTATGLFQGLNDERPEPSDMFGTLVRGGILEERIKDYASEVKNDGFLTGVRSRSDNDLAHFEQNWTGSRRDAYRFTTF